jgi:hypothetical protein
MKKRMRRWWKENPAGKGPGRSGLRDRREAAVVVVKLMGGLGNQMFQYAAGRSLALRLGAALKLDRSYLDGPQTGNTRRSFELDGLKVLEKFADPWEVAELTGRESTWPRMLFLRLRQALGFTRFRPNVLRESDFRFQPEFQCASGDVYLEGFWQSEKYFAGIAEILRNEFSIGRSLEGRDRAFAEAIAGGNTVSVHVRRGDYVRHPEAFRYHGVCGMEYYRRCMEIISGKVQEPHYVVFTDEPGWARENFPGSCRMTFVDWDSPRKGCVDLELMRKCRHHIIANSSFSWWGAWLCENPEKMVLAPERWVIDPSVDTKDLLPESWVRV